MVESQSCALLWEVEFPEQKRASIGARKPLAVLVIKRSDGEGERISVPMTVGRILSSKQKSGEIEPSSRAELMYMLGELSRSCARTRIQRLIDRREYSSEEIRQKLKLDGYAKATIDTCLGRALEAGLVSDARFADSFIRSKLYAGWGALRIERELARRGIEVDKVRGWPYDYFDPDDELERAYELAGRRSVNGPRAYEKLVRYLANRGFSLSVAKRAAQQTLAKNSD